MIVRTREGVEYSFPWYVVLKIRISATLAALYDTFRMVVHGGPGE